MLLPFADLFVCGGAGAIAILGSARLPLGLAAGTLGRLDDAVRHLRAAAEVNERAGVPPFTALARYHLARVLARRRRPGDRAEAAAWRPRPPPSPGSWAWPRCCATPATWRPRWPGSGQAR